MIKILAETTDDVRVRIQLTGTSDDIAREAALICIKLADDIISKGDELADLFEDYTKDYLDYFYGSEKEEGKS